MSDDNVIDLGERRKRDMPKVQTGMRDVMDIAMDLINTMEARGERILLAVSGDWTLRLEKPTKEQA